MGWFDDNPAPADEYSGGGGVPHQDPTTGAWVDNFGNPTNTGIGGMGNRIPIPGQPGQPPIGPLTDVGGDNSWWNPADPQGSFTRLVAGKPANSETLRSLEPQLKAAGITIEPANVAGASHKIRFPDGRVVRVGNHFDGGGETSWGWTDQGIAPTGGSPTGQGNPSGINGPFGATPFDFKFDENDPSYQFLKKEVLDATTNSQFAKGTGLTGGAAIELQNRAGGLASAEYQNEFDRQLRTNQTNFGQGLAANQNYWGQQTDLAHIGLDATRLDLNAAAGQASYGSGYANNQSGLYGDIGNAQASGIVGGANARNRFYESLLSGIPF